MANLLFFRVVQPQREIQKICLLIWTKLTLDTNLGFRLITLLTVLPSFTHVY